VPQNTSASRLIALLVGVGLAASGCNAATPSEKQAVPAPAGPAAQVAVVDVAPQVGNVAAHLAALAGPRLRPDVLVTGTKALTPAEVHRVIALAPGSIAYATGSVHLTGKIVHVASVDPATFRRFDAAGTAESTAVWQTVANGGVIASHDLAKRLGLRLGKEVQVVGPKTLALRLGAFATTGIPDTDLVVDAPTGRSLGIVKPTAVLLNAGKKDPASLASQVRMLTGPAAEVDLLTAPAANPVAFLTGSRAAKAFGAFSYTFFPDGTIQPNSTWVATNIQTATVPILGRVTCHRLMIPQLRGALQDVANAGLSSSLHTYDGCYVPRFIERNPSHAISLHTWGIAIDMDASTNYRGIKGTMDPRVVTIFKRWGFRWGGEWTYTDPMHFEIGALLNS
jgi:hypothetical protein